MPTVVPFHRAVLDDPAFTATDGRLGVHTRWIETEFSGEIAPYDVPPVGTGPPEEKTTVVVEVDGKRLAVVLPAGLGGSGRTGGARPTAGKPTRRRGGGGAGAGPSGDALTSPMQGTIVKVVVAEGDAVEAGDLVVVLEAMKMEQPLNAHRAGSVTDLSAEVGATVSSGSVVCRIIDA